MKKKKKKSIIVVVSVLDWRLLDPSDFWFLEARASMIPNAALA